MGAWGRGEKHAAINVPHAGASVGYVTDRHDAPARQTWPPLHRRPSPRHPSQVVNTRECATSKRASEGELTAGTARVETLSRPGPRNSVATRSMLWHGLPTVTRCTYATMETFGRAGGTVGRPCHNRDTNGLPTVPQPLTRWVPGAEARGPGSLSRARWGIVTVGNSINRSPSVWDVDCRVFFAPAPGTHPVS